ncbi:Ser-Thr-rich glycosyl-phosphatidyl-inositol-anchored membrane family domain-containing protein [Trichoderma evansii]
MRFTLTVPALMALVGSAFAQTADFDPVTVPTNNQHITAGAPFTIEWQAPAKYAGNTISIQLIGGPTQATQVPLDVIATGIANSAGKFVWNVPATLGADAFYGFIVRSENDQSVFQYSNPFHVDKAASPPAQGTTTVTTSTGVKTVSLATQSTSAPYSPPVVTSAPYSPPAVTDVTVVLNATTTVPCNGTVAPPTLTAPTTLQSATRLPPPPPSSPVWVPPGQAATTTYAVAASGTAAPSNPPGTPLPPPTNAGVRVAGSSFALVASLVVAYFAL